MTLVGEKVFYVFVRKTIRYADRDKLLYQNSQPNRASNTNGLWGTKVAIT